MQAGDKIFVPDKKLTVDKTVTGGEATVKSVLRGGEYVKMVETDDIQWHVPTLERHQDDYKKQYTGQQARLYDEPFERDNLIW